MKPCRLYRSILALTFILLADCASPSSQPDPDLLSTAVAATLQAISSPTPLEPRATPAPPTPEITLWLADGGGGDRIWVLGDGQPHQRLLPVNVGEYYGYARSTNRILMATRWGVYGAGPGNVSVSDLSILEFGTGQITTLLTDNVVEAAWAPNGRELAYILATPTTYELHWRSDDGTDHILASDVTFTWGISPTGDKIAFTRESGYEIDIDPGFYVVDVRTAQETKLSDVDKSGTGSIADRPFWNYAGDEVILSHYSGPGEARLVWAKVDGSETHDLGLQSGSGDRWANVSIPYLLWDPDGEHLYAVQAASIGEGDMGGPSPLVRYRLDHTNWTLSEGEKISELLTVIGWAVPGYSLWIWDAQGDIQEFVLP